jgi:hypothetical protein
LRQEVEFEDMVDNGKDSRYVSSASKEYAKDSFRKAPSALRKEMKAMLRMQFEAEALLYKKFERQPAEAKNRYPNFIELPFERKQSIVNSLEKHDALLDKYKRMLEGALGDKLIGRKEYEESISIFTRERLDNKQKTFDDFASGIDLRRKVLERFEKELPEDIKSAHMDFYEMKHYDRMELVEKLLNENARKTAEKKEKPEKKEEAKNILKPDQLREMSARAVELHNKGSVEQARALYQTVLIYDPDNAEAKKYLSQKDEKAKAAEGKDPVSDQSLRENLKSVQRERGIKEDIKRVNIAGGLAELSRNSEFFNSGKVRSKDKDGHLDGKEKKLNKRLLEFTDGNVVAGHLHEKARKVKKVDFRQLRQMTDGEISGLRDEVLNNQGEKAGNAFHIQLEDRSSGREIAGKSGVNWAKKAEKAIRADMVQKAAEKLKADGRELSPEERARLKREAENEDLKVNLREAA